MKCQFNWSVVMLAGALAGVPQLAQAQGAQKLFFEGDMVAGAHSGPICVLKSQYTHGQIVVWRVRLQDQTGKKLDNKGVKSLVIELPDGKTFPMHYGPHPKGRTDDYFWTTSWQIPADYPTGTFSYKVVATSLSGDMQTWAPFNVKLSELTIVK